MPMVTFNGTTVPPLILCDQASLLTSNMLKPYSRKDFKKDSPQEGFNRKLSPARQVVENAFERVKARFRFIMRRMECEWLSDMETEDKIYLQPVCTTDAEADNGSVRDAHWRVSTQSSRQMV
ncbi:hypothetical protein IscW_ISCW004686 [Ixodes scapularis]|uniref:DDE Tnp4 domain-containing protein n=1 Tax=Ixodes scapularis TaxID=6945 RepID=B7PER5_IXOSC|nr:hypothetical protein IscW_ISCW004686 [Ixodes scapularis]|eukprot:XP_002433687.1 hypothetical protein IscW_ISCW004686 [Ixodes scapularis]